jgi:uracil phosphoribosyltransferase
VEAPHPLIKHWVSVLRDENISSSILIFSKLISISSDWKLAEPIGNFCM